MRWLGIGILLSCVSANVAAQTQPGWTVDAAVYSWLSATEGTLGAGGTDVEVDNSFTDTLEQSDSLLAFMGRVQAWRGDAGLFLDGVYVDLGYDDAAVGSATADASSELGIVEIGGLYRFGRWPWGADRSWSLEGLAGARYTYIGSEIEVEGGPSAEQTTDWVDPFVGLRASAALSDRWDVSLRGDIGGFGVGSDFAWQAEAFVGYGFRLFGADAKAVAGYRVLDQDYDDDLTWDVTLHGPVLGLNIRF